MALGSSKVKGESLVTAAKARAERKKKLCLETDLREYMLYICTWIDGCSSRLQYFHSFERALAAL